jgi:hypothetical protein
MRLWNWAALLGLALTAGVVSAAPQRRTSQPAPRPTPQAQAPRPATPARTGYTARTTRPVSNPAGATGQTQRWTSPQGNTRRRTDVTLPNGNRANVEVGRNRNGPTVTSTQHNRNNEMVRRDTTRRLADGTQRNVSTRYTASGVRDSATVQVRPPNGGRARTYQVPFDSRGNPDFYGYARRLPNNQRAVQIPMTGNRSRDFAAADRAAGYTPSNPRPAGYTWHHHQNRRSMILVPSDLHGAIPHRGGVSGVRSGQP